MNELFFSGGATLFTVAAAIGTIVFGFRMAMMLIGFDSDMEGALDFDGGDSGDAFTLLSLNVISALLMGFGWAGLAALKGSGWSWLLSLGVGASAGLAMAWFSAKAMQMIHRMHSSGTFGIEQALLLEGTVYTNIPGHREGRGQVRVVIDNHARFYNAVTDGPPVASRTLIRVTEINEDNTVTIARADATNALPKE